MGGLFIGNTRLESGRAGQGGRNRWRREGDYYYGRACINLQLLLTLPRWVRSGASHPRSGEDELEGKGAQANIGWLYGLTKGRDTKLEGDWRGVSLGWGHELLVDQRVDLCPHAYAANLATARLSTAVRNNWLSSRGATMGVPVEVYVGGYICMTA